MFVTSACSQSLLIATAHVQPLSEGILSQGFQNFQNSPHDPEHSATQCGNGQSVPPGLLPNSSRTWHKPVMPGLRCDFPLRESNLPGASEGLQKMGKSQMAAK